MNRCARPHDHRRSDPAEGFTRLTYEILADQGGSTRLTITHDLTGAPRLAEPVGGDLEEQGDGGGWAWDVSSSPESMLETGERIRRPAGSTDDFSGCVTSNR